MADDSEMLDREALRNRIRQSQKELDPAWPEERKRAHIEKQARNEIALGVLIGKAKGNERVADWLGGKCGGARQAVLADVATG